MALFTLSRINVCGVGLQKSVTRVGNTASLSLRVTNGSKDLPVRGGRGSPLWKPRRETGDPRTEKMPEDQDWTSVYPAAASFRPDSIPLPVRMGYPVKGGVPPEKKGNLELIKIPNFLHLTPSAIKKHCEALKPFCTEWPSALDTDAKCDKHFPIKVESTDYVSAGPSVRNPLARVVSLKVELSSLKLDDHARKKMIKLVGERYCKDTDVLTITAESCPLRKQNKDYAMYLLTVLYHESWVDAMTARQAANGARGLEKYYLCERSIKEEKTEAWEAEKTVADMEEYSWEDSPSQRNILDVLARMECAVEKEGEEVREELLGRKEVQEYRDSVARLKNEGESEATLTQYKEAVKKVLNL